MGFIDCLNSICGLAWPSIIVFLLSSLDPGALLPLPALASGGRLGLETV